MSSIQEKMEALRLQKAAYKTGGAHSRSFQYKQKKPSAHPSLPRATTKPPSPYQSSHQSLFPSSTNKEGGAGGRSGTNSTTPSCASYSPIQTQRNSLPPSSSSDSHEVMRKNSKEEKRARGLDPLQNCYGVKSRTAHLKREGSEESQEMIPKSILSRPSSPALSPNSSGKKKRVTFNSQEMHSTSSYGPPSPIVSRPSAHKNTAPAPTNQLSRRVRPSLSDQLSAIADKASDITAEIKVKAGLEHDNIHNETPLLSSPAKNFTVGHLQCRYPAPVEFFNDRFEYKFHHPYQNAEILLIMYYRDMSNVTLTASPAPGKLIFRVPRHLVHFSTDYDPSKHFVVLFLSSGSDVLFIRKNILPKISD